MEKENISIYFGTVSASGSTDAAVADEYSSLYDIRKGPLIGGQCGTDYIGFDCDCRKLVSIRNWTEDLSVSDIWQTWKRYYFAYRNRNRGTGNQYTDDDRDTDIASKDDGNI